jgi:putative SOS response-associated peptidase YedK
MCGRYLLHCTPDILAELLDLTEIPIVPPRYNIAPTQNVAVCRRTDKGRELAFLRWGLVPSWSDDEKIGYKLLNARSETAAEKPAFRSAFRQRRCLIPATGFYEWQKQGKKKQPFMAHRADQRPFVFAGLWERNEREGAPPLETCTILTTEANALLRPLHERMPVILTKDVTNQWMDPAAKPEQLKTLLKPIGDDFLTLTAVNPIVNNARVDDPRCAEPLGDGKLFCA